MMVARVLENGGLSLRFTLCGEGQRRACCSWKKSDKRGTRGEVDKTGEGGSSYGARQAGKKKLEMRGRWNGTWKNMYISVCGFMGRRERNGEIKDVERQEQAHVFALLLNINQKDKESPECTGLRQFKA